MVTDTPPEAHNDSHPASDLPLIAPQRLPKKRSWKRGVIVLVIFGCVVSAAALIANSTSTEETGPRLTHTITRCDLVVTVTEQGILESAENNEIKCKVRGRNAVLWIIESGTFVNKGDELVRLDALFIQEQIDERTKYANWSQSAADRTLANVARAILAVPEYEQGRYVADLMTRKKDLVIAEAELRSAKDNLSHAELMAKSEYTSQLEVEEKDFAVKQAVLEVALKRAELDVLKRHTKNEQSQTLKGNLKAISARHKANAERALADKSRRDRAVDEIQYCVVTAPKSGMVIHPNAAKWETAPIAEGTRVYKDQVLLLMPDLSKMQVKVGIHESVIDRMQEGLSVIVTLPNSTIDGTVSSISSVTKPAGWWTGNEVKYDTLIALPAVEGLKPGMSAEVEVIIARYQNVLTIPVAAVAESGAGHYCWVKTREGPKRRPLVLGDSNNIFTIVEKGLEEGDEVMLNPLAFGAPELETTKSRDELKTQQPD